MNAVRNDVSGRVSSGVAYICPEPNPNPNPYFCSYVVRSLALGLWSFVFGEIDHHLKSLTREPMMIGATR